MTMACFIWPLAPAVIAGGVSLLGSIGNWLSGTSNQRKQNEFNAAEAEKQRQWASQQNFLNNQFSSAEARAGRNWQAQQNVLARQWQEDIYNRYSSPAAMMRQYREAGLNPYLGMSGNVGSGMSASAPMSGATSVGSPSSMSGAAASAAGQPISMNLDPAGIVRSLAESSNQSAQSVSEFVKSAIEVYKNLGKDAYDKFVEKFSPIFTKSNPVDSLMTRQIEAQIHNTEVQSAVADYGLQLTKKFGEKERWTAISEANQRISESVARLQVNKLLSDAQVRKIASDIIVNAAQSFKLRREGEKFTADAVTANALREYVVRIAKADAQLRSNSAYASDVALESNESLFGWITSSEGKHSKANASRIAMKRNADALWTAIDKMFTDYIHVGVGGFVGSSGQAGTSTTEVRAPLE